MNKISRILIDEINQVPILDFMEKEYERDFTFNKSSNWANTNCPMPNHDDSSPSFGVNTESNMFHCFGCGCKGDLIKLVQMVEGLNFIESIQKIANYAGIQLNLADLDIKNILKELSKNVENYFKHEDNNKFPGGLSEINFLIAFSDRTKRYLRKINFHHEEVQWIDSLYTDIEKFTEDENYKELSKLWNNFNSESKMRSEKYG